jgi:hypothetical protein
MSSGWLVFLFLFILGITAQTFNTFGIWDVKYPNSGYAVDSGQISTAVQNAKDAPITIFVGYTWAIQFVTIIASGLLAVISLGLLFYAMGWPVGVAGAGVLTLVQAPATLISLVWVYELITGRNVG